jgi:ketosteroid isomerase-like protein
MSDLTGIPIHAAWILLIASCSSEQKQSAAATPEDLINMERAYCKMALEEGFNKATLFYADSQMVKLSDGEFPVIGLGALQQKFADGRDTKNLSWEPVDAEVSSSGDLGYTWGNWRFDAPDTVLHGNYFTVWKKQPDGSWKIALDGGNATPQP